MTKKAAYHTNGIYHGSFEFYPHIETVFTDLGLKEYDPKSKNKQDDTYSKEIIEVSRIDIEASKKNQSRSLTGVSINPATATRYSVALHQKENKFPAIVLLEMPDRRLVTIDGLHRVACMFPHEFGLKEITPCPQATKAAAFVVRSVDPEIVEYLWNTFNEMNGLELTMEQRILKAVDAAEKGKTVEEAATAFGLRPRDIQPHVRASKVSRKLAAASLKFPDNTSTDLIIACGKLAKVDMVICEDLIKNIIPDNNVSEKEKTKKINELVKLNTPEIRREAYDKFKLNPAKAVKAAKAVYGNGNKNRPFHDSILKDMYRLKKSMDRSSEKGLTGKHVPQPIYNEIISVFEEIQEKFVEFGEF